MNSQSGDTKQSQDRRIAAALLAVVVTLFAALLTLTLSRGKPDYVVVLVTGTDCRRNFSDSDCQGFVSRAQILHARSAPRFRDVSTCSLVFGTGRCEAIVENGVTLNIFAPRMAAIALTRAGDLIVPLHYGPSSESGPEALHAGQAVYFKDRKVGRITETSMGGADLPQLNDAEGNPLTADALRRVSD